VRTMEQLLSLLDGESQRPRQSSNQWSLNDNILVIVEQEQSSKLANCSYVSFNFGAIKGDHYIIHSKLQTAHMLPSPFWVASMEIIICDEASRFHWLFIRVEMPICDEATVQVTKY
jgi:hypothetical protein